MNIEVRALKDNLDTQKSASRGILTGILPKNSETCELKPKLMP